MEFKRNFVDIVIPYVTLYLAGCVAARHEDVVADLDVAFTHQGADAVVAAVYEYAVRDADIAFHIHVKTIFISVGISLQGNE